MKQRRQDRNLDKEIDDQNNILTGEGDKDTVETLTYGGVSLEKGVQVRTSTPQYRS